ncbi:MAG: hypothetical protein IJ112_07430 [Oscillospiraceae bacterium]|nr:hypothetical protein [Oscillospiraceae bacterium]
MSASDLSLRLANRPLLRAIRQRRQPAPVYETVLVEPETDADRMLTLLMALAPMAFAFFYLAFLALMLFH